MAKYTQEQLEHYLSHPEEVDATNTELVEALATGALADLGDIQGGKTKGIDPPPKAEEDEDAKEADRAIAEAEAKVAAEKEAEKLATTSGAKDGKTGTAQEDASILTVDGKHVIPNAVLKEARERAAGATAALAEAQQSIVALADEVKALRAGKEPARAADDPHNKTVAELREMLKDVEKEAPWQVPVLEKFIEAVELAQAEIADLRGARAQDDRQIVQSLEQQAADAKENNATLVLWDTQAPELFSEAVKFDTFIRSDSQMRERYPTFEARFAAAVEMVKASHAGEAIPLPETVDTSKAPVGKEPAKTPSATDIQARAKAVLDKASVDSVRTLSDITGGVGEVAAHEALERMSSAEVGAKFSNMTPQQIVDWTMAH